MVRNNDDLAPSGRPPREPRGYLGIPWPLWVMFIGYLGSGIVVMATVTTLVKRLDIHEARPAHFEMHREMGIAKTKLSDHEKRLDRLEARNYGNTQ